MYELLPRTSELHGDRETAMRVKGESFLYMSQRKMRAEEKKRRKIQARRVEFHAIAIFFHGEKLRKKSVQRFQPAAIHSLPSGTVLVNLPVISLPSPGPALLFSRSVSCEINVDPGSVSEHRFVPVRDPLAESRSHESRKTRNDRS